MKTLLRGWMAMALVCGAFNQAAAVDKVAVTSFKRPVAATKGNVGGAGSKAKKSESLTYELRLQNQTLADLPKLTVEYVIFVQRQRLGERMTDPPRIDRVTGSQTVDVLSNRAPQSITTTEVTLNKENLVGTYHYINGGRIKAEDSVVGIWVRISQDGQLIAEYANPGSVTSRGWEKK